MSRKLLILAAVVASLSIGDRGTICGHSNVRPTSRRSLAVPNEAPIDAVCAALANAPLHRLSGSVLSERW